MFGGNPFDDYNPNDPASWYDTPVPPSPWDAPQSSGMPGWLQQYAPQAINAAIGVMQLPFMFNQPASQPAAPQVQYGPEPSNPEDDLRALRMYRARQSYENNFGAPGPFGSAASVTSSPDALLNRIRQARRDGWRPA